MEIAYNLYRVSTKKQVDKEGNDIPMQKTACREFLGHKGWTIGKEFEEKGVSGFKVFANDRDVIQDRKMPHFAKSSRSCLFSCLTESVELMTKRHLSSSGS